jgi:integrase
LLRRHKTAKKTGRPRVVYLCPEAVELTREQMARHAEGPLFVNSRGQPWTRNAVRIRFRNLRRKHPALTGVIAYTYRSSFATDALEARVPEASVAALLGHTLEARVPEASVAALLGHTSTATLHRFYNRLSARVGHLKDAAATATRQPPSAAGDGPPAAPSAGSPGRPRG